MKFNQAAFTDLFIVYAAPNAFDSQGIIDANARCTWDRAFANYVFDDDGSVCGVEVSE